MSHVPEFDVSVVIVSFNTRDLLRECLTSLYNEAAGLRCQVIVVDNNSRDASADMVAEEFPEAVLIRSGKNLGFAGANNAGFRVATGKYVVLLNSDAFLTEGALHKSFALMEAHPEVGLAGGRLVGRDGSWQPSARMFPSLLNEFLSFSGLSIVFAESRFFGRQDRTWASQDDAASVDWVPGAYSILRRDALEQIGYFDEAFFLYYEEVDLCRRFKQAGYQVQYWPQLRVIHLGGESSKTISNLTMSKSGSQLTLWRMRSELLYFRKHHGSRAFWAKLQEQMWHRLRALRNRLQGGERGLKAEESQLIVQLWQRAWQETHGGRLSPARPW